MPLAEI
ncbi:hypothetical protein D049_1221A, partial [Vibrio parahaemolyticus VPTS-2010]